MTGANSKFKFLQLDMVDNVLSQYPDKRSAVLPLLHLAQSQEGYISAGVLETIANIVAVTSAEIASTVSFYTMFNTEPLGKYNLQVCQTRQHIIYSFEFSRYSTTCGH